MSDLKFFIFTVLFLSVGCLILYLIALGENKKVKFLRETIKTVTDANDYLRSEINRRNSIDEIKSNNRKESTEKINDLYDGDLVDNAIDVLCNNEKG